MSSEMMNFINGAGIVSYSPLKIYQLAPWNNGALEGDPFSFAVW